MSTRRQIPKRGSLKSSFTPPANPLKTRGFGKGIQARSAELPKTNPLQTRPFGSPIPASAQQEETESASEQLEIESRFGYNGLDVPVNAPGTLPTPPVQRKEGKLGNWYQLQTPRTNPVLNRLSLLRAKGFDQVQTIQGREASSEEKLQEQPEAGIEEQQPLLAMQKEEVEERTVLRYGSRGKDVVYLQRRINLHGADLVEDGIFGSKTHKAVTAFQRDHTLSVDGIVGSLTWAALDRPPDTAISDEKKGINDQVEMGFDGGITKLGINPSSKNKIPDVFGGLVARDLIDRDLADMLNEMHHIGNWAQQSAHFAHTELSNGNLVGLVSANSSAKIQKRLHKKHHQKLANTVAFAMSNNAVTETVEETGGYLRGMILVNPGLLTRAAASKPAREFAYLVIAHELNHHRNRVQRLKLFKEGIDKKNSGTVYVDPQLANSFSNTANTRSLFIDELAARHVAWNVQQDIKGKKGKISPLNQGQFYKAAIQFATNFSHYGDSGYMQALHNKDKSKFREQVAQWLHSLNSTLFHSDPVQNKRIQSFMLHEYFTAMALNYAEPSVQADGMA